MFKIKKLKNFAVIETLENELEFKDLTIFMGDNSAGKSYLAMLMHSLVSMTRGYSDLDFLKAITNKFDDTSIFKHLKDAINSLVSTENDITISLSLEKKELEELENIIYFSINEYLIKKYLTSKLFKSNNLENIEIEFISLEKSLIDTLNISMDKDEFGTPMIDIKFGASLFKSGMRFPNNFPIDLMSDEIFNTIISNLIEHSIKNVIPKNSVYLPASRTGYLQTYKVLAKQAIEENYSLDDNSSKSTLSVIVRFFIMQLNDSRDFKNDKFSIFIEKFIMNGKVNVYADNNDINFELSNGETIDINYLSSTVSELIPLVVFLKRGLIQKNGLLVIEEPEAHLSFKNQKMMAKLIAFLIQNQIKVLITTHSDFLIYELNNLILTDTVLKNKDKLSKDEVGNIQDTEISLLHKKVAIYNFILNDNNRSKVTKVKVDEYGIDNEYIVKNTYEVIDKRQSLLDLIDKINA
jgi:predicted ATPase